MALNAFLRLKHAMGIALLRGDSAGRMEVVFGGNFVPQSSVDLAGTTETFYTCPQGKKAKLWVYFSNNDASANREVTFNLVPMGGSPGSSNEVLDSVVIPANTPPLELGPFALSAGMTAGGFASSANTVTAHVYVEEFDA